MVLLSLRAGAAPATLRVSLAFFLLALALVAGTRPAKALPHTVQPGETLSGIATYYDVDLQALAALNGISNLDRVYVGQQLAIPGLAEPGPGRVTYVVQAGDTLSLIAIANGVTLQALVEANGLTNADRIFAGEALTIPAPPPRAVLVSGAPRISRAQAEAILRQVEAEFGLPNGLLLALAWQESGWQQDVVSPVGAIGLMQILPSTAEWALEWLAPEEVDWEMDPLDNARMGAAVLSHWLALTGGDTWAALAIYYQGWGSIEQQGPFEETYRYVANVLAVVPRFASGS